MLVCTKCKEDLECVKNGVGLDYGQGHISASDLYACPVCGVSIAKANDAGYVDPDHQFHDLYIDMTVPAVPKTVGTMTVLCASSLGGFTDPDHEIVCDRLALVAAVDAMIDALRVFDGQHLPTNWTVYANLVANAITLGDECGYDWTEDTWPVGLTAALQARKDGA